jgi:hypothetical protein
MIGCYSFIEKTLERVIYDCEQLRWKCKQTSQSGETVDKIKPTSKTEIDLNQTYSWNVSLKRPLS